MLVRVETRLRRVAAEAQQRADALGPAAESALQAADSAVRTARLAAVKLRAQVQLQQSLFVLRQIPTARAWHLLALRRCNLSSRTPALGGAHVTPAVHSSSHACLERELLKSDSEDFSLHYALIGNDAACAPRLPTP